MALRPEQDCLQDALGRAPFRALRACLRCTGDCRTDVVPRPRRRISFRPAACVPKEKLVCVSTSEGTETESALRQNDIQVIHVLIFDSMTLLGITQDRGCADD